MSCRKVSHRLCAYTVHYSLPLFGHRLQLNVIVKHQVGNEFSKRVKICSFFRETLTQTASHKWINNKTQIKHCFLSWNLPSIGLNTQVSKIFLKICLVCLSPIIKKLDIQLTWYVNCPPSCSCDSEQKLNFSEKF